MLAHVVSQVFSVERVRTLAENAQRALRTAGVRNASVLLGDGTLGWRGYSPYDAFLVAAGGPEFPVPLMEQLALGGRLLIPIGDRGAQTLTLLERTAEGTRQRALGAALFVPLVGEHGFDA